MNLKVLFLFFLPSFLGASTTVDIEIDWGHGRLFLMAHRPLEEGILPQDHPFTLELLEQELNVQLHAILRELPLEEAQTIGERLLLNPELAQGMEKVGDLLVREWSRLSLDHSAVEARYRLDLFPLLSSLIPMERGLPLPKEPLGWVPVPQDDWTGLVIYLPQELPLQGTRRKVASGPVLLPRILAPDFSVLAGSRIVKSENLSSWGVAAYASLSERDNFEERVGRRPYRVMARGAYDETAFDLIISEEAVRQLLTAPSGRRILQEGRILIISDSTLP